MFADLSVEPEVPVPAGPSCLHPAPLSGSGAAQGQRDESVLATGGAAQVDHQGDAAVAKKKKRKKEEK